jgi:hypothetical protein
MRIVSCVVLLLCACHSDDSELVDGAAIDAAMHADLGASPNDASTPADLTSPGDLASSPCVIYCANVMANCSGANAQYASLASCLGMCAAMPVGTTADTSGNTLGCRAHYAGTPAMSSPSTNCAAAGPTGGDVIVSDAAEGTCGDGCDSFCTVAQAICTGTDKQFADKSVCVDACHKLAAIQAKPYSTADNTTNDWGCRVTQLALAAASAADATTDCQYIVPNSSVCKN